MLNNLKLEAAEPVKIVNTANRFWIIRNYQLHLGCAEGAKNFYSKAFFENSFSIPSFSARSVRGRATTGKFPRNSKNLAATKVANKIVKSERKSIGFLSLRPDTAAGLVRFGARDYDPEAT